MKRFLIILLIVLCIAAIGVAGWFGYLAFHKDQPSQQTPPPTQTAQAITRTFTSPKGVVIELNDWKAQPSLTSPLTITGKVPGNWSFEATFPVILKDAAGNTLVQKAATLQGDWMTDQLVPFSVTLTFERPTGTSPTGTLVLQKDNPSGLSTNEDSVEIPVSFE